MHMRSTGAEEHGEKAPLAAAAAAAAALPMTTSVNPLPAQS